MKRALVKFLPVLLLGSLTVACTAEDIDPGSRVVSMRVLAVNADIPYAHPGETVNLTTLSHDPAGRAVSWLWAVCENPRSASVPGCFAKIEEQVNAGQNPVLAQGEGIDSLAYTVPESAINNVVPEARPSALVGFLNVACPGTISLEAGGPAGLPFRCVERETGRELGLEEFVVGVKRVFLRTSDRNQNPVVARVLFDGAEWPETEIKDVDPCNTTDNAIDDCPDRTQHKISVELLPESFETGRDEFGRDFTEQVIIQHYSTEGIFKDQVRIANDPATKFAPRTGIPGTEITLWFVARDDRGGVTWTERRVRLR